MKVALKQLSDTDSAQPCTYALNAGPTLVGRSDNCSLILSSPSVSRWHCILDLTSDGLQVTDLHSLNGTYINDRRIIRQLLVHDDRLRIGEVSFLVSIDSADSALGQAEDRALLALTGTSTESAHELAPTDFSRISAVAPRSRTAAAASRRKPPSEFADLPAPQIAQKLARYEKALDGCSAQLKLLVEKISALESRLNAITLHQPQPQESHQLAPQKAFERHDAMMYIARAAVCDKVRQQSHPPSTISVDSVGS